MLEIDLADYTGRVVKAYLAGEDVGYVLERIVKGRVGAQALYDEVVEIFRPRSDDRLTLSAKRKLLFTTMELLRSRAQDLQLEQRHTTLHLLTGLLCSGQDDYQSLAESFLRDFTSHGKLEILIRHAIGSEFMVIYSDAHD